jgi:hypothetical protein
MLLTFPFLALASSLGALVPSVSHTSDGTYTSPLCPVFQHAAAAPIRVTVITGSGGQVIAPSNGGVPPELMRLLAGGHLPMGQKTTRPAGFLENLDDSGKHHVQSGKGGKGCSGGRGRGRGGALGLSNGLRAALGLPPIAPETGTVVIMGHSHGRPPLDKYVGVTKPIASKNTSFLERVHTALLSLGTWEARAVAFVLGASFCIFTPP